jgi:hypothetical protein
MDAYYGNPVTAVPTMAPVGAAPAMAPTTVVKVPPSGAALTAQATATRNTRAIAIGGVIAVIALILAIIALVFATSSTATSPAPSPSPSPSPSETRTTVVTTATVPWSLATVPITIVFYRTGSNSEVELVIPQLSGVAVAGGLNFIRIGTGTSIPSSLRPLSVTRQVVTCLNAGVRSLGNLQVTPAGDITIEAAYVGGPPFAGRCGTEAQIVMPYVISP